MSLAKHIVVVGAGISGLSAAYWLAKKGYRVTVMEKGSSPGGTMKTIREGGWLVETGPNSALESTPLLADLFGDLGIAGEKIYANPAAKRRYIVRSGVLEELPSGPLSFLGSRLWSLRGKARLLKEPFVGRARWEETVAEFVERRLGREFLDYTIDPFVAGVYAGSPEKLSVQAAFPKLHALESAHGSLMKGAIFSRRSPGSKTRSRLFSFVRGMQSLPDALAGKLGKNVLCSVSVINIIPARAGRLPVYTVSYEENGQRSSLEADGVVLAAPAHASAEIVRAIDPEMASGLEAIYYPPVAEIFTGYRRDQIGRQLDGFGFLVPKVEGRRILGSIWSSALFPERSPQGFEGITTFVGGARQPDLVSFDDGGLAGIAAAELRELIGVRGEPVYTRISRWDRAIPQYNLGHGRVVRAMERFEENYRGAFFCSNFKGGIAVGDCVESARAVADRAGALLG